MLIALFSAGAGAQDYPSKPVRIIVPLPAGSTGEAMARLVADNLAQKTGQSFIVETRPGASGQIGAAAVAKAPPDGYTLMVASVGPVTINPAVYGAKLGFDPLKDFTPITQIANTTSVIIMHPSVPVKTLAQLITFAKARPGQLMYASAGNTSTTNLYMALLSTMTGIKMLHVPYKGSTQGMISVASGETQLMITGWINALPMTKQGKVRPLAVVSARRSPVAPQLQAIGEVVPGYDADQWYGVLAPAGTPKNIIGLLHTTIVNGLQTPEARAYLTQSGAEPVGNTPEQFGARIRAEIAKWTKIVNATGAKPQ